MSRRISFSTSKLSNLGTGHFSAAKPAVGSISRKASRARMLGLLPAAGAKSNSGFQHRYVRDELALGTIAHPHLDLLAFRQLTHIAAAQGFHMDEDVGRAD